MVASTNWSASRRRGLLLTRGVYADADSHRDPRFADRYSHFLCAALLSVRPRLEVAGELAPIRRPLFQKRIAALDGFIGHVGQAGGLTGEQLLAHQPVVE